MRTRRPASSVSSRVVGQGPTTLNKIYINTDHKQR